MAALVADLIDPDPLQPGQRVRLRELLGGHPLDDMADRPPEMRISWVIVVFEHAAASHATWSSKNRVCPAPCRAHGTAAVITPCSRQRTCGAPASSTARTVPRSSARQRRRPDPPS